MRAVLIMVVLIMVLLLAPAVATVVACALAPERAPWLVGVYVVMSAVTFAAYWRDKSAARANRWRTAEATLQLLSLLGGWPGALIAQQTLRHKTRKLSFQVVFWLIGIGHAGFWAWWLVIRP